MLNHFEVAAGSFVGRSHIGRDTMPIGGNNQDGWHVLQTQDLIAGVVCDGCGSSSASEVGSRLGARLVCEGLRRNLSRFAQDGLMAEDIPLILKRTRDDVLANIRVLARSLGESLTEVVDKYFLFTVVGFFITEQLATTFSIGDGVIYWNGDEQILGPFPDNAPPYLGYALIDSGYGAFDLGFQVNHCAPAESITTILIGTDGVVQLMGLLNVPVPGRKDVFGPLSQFWLEDNYFSNSQAVTRRLRLLNRLCPLIDWREQKVVPQGGLLDDDTTLVVLRRLKGKRSL